MGYLSFNGPKLQGPCQEVGLLIKILYTYNIQCKFLMSTYQDSHVSESLQTLTIHVGTWGDSILYSGIIHQGPFPGMVLEVKI